MNKVAVTSASGKLGGEVVRTLIDIIGKENVIGLARTPRKAQLLDIEIRPGDYNLPGDLNESLRGVDAVLLVSGMDAPDKRIVQHRNVIQAAKNAGVNRIVYTSIQGAESGTGFSPVVKSNRQTEDIQNSGLEWAIGRNGIYIEPDVEYISNYKQRGEITNCAGEGMCGYTTRNELAFAYARMLTGTNHSGKTYSLHGERITQAQLASYLNLTFGTELFFRDMSVAEYRTDRVAELGEFLGSVIAGIYEGIRQGANDSESHFEKAAGREHLSWRDYFAQLKQTL